MYTKSFKIHQKNVELQSKCNPAGSRNPAGFPRQILQSRKIKKRGIWSTVVSIKKGCCGSNPMFGLWQTASTILCTYGGCYSMTCFPFLRAYTKFVPHYMAQNSFLDCKYILHCLLLLYISNKIAFKIKS